MDSVLKKLGDFGLENFITNHRHELCSRTVNQIQIATFLGVDADQISIIMEPPDNFSRNVKLYDYISITATVRSFVEVLEQTGNEHLILFIRSAPLDSNSNSAKPISSSKNEIWFNIPELINSFLGREAFLVQLHEQLQHAVEESLEINVISGLGGMGKSQAARKYISKYFESYDNFIWIDAETEGSMRNSFVPLARELKISIENSEGNSRDLDQIVKDIYNKISQSRKATLIVFDNAEDFEGCRKFLPFLSHPKMQKPKVLITSRNQEWLELRSSTTTAENNNVKIQVVPLNVLTNSECFEFILSKLKISDGPEFRHESFEFIELIGGLPLALQQAVAYIKLQRKSISNQGHPYTISDYVQDFKSRMQKLNESSPISVPGSSTVADTWSVTFEKILCLENGAEAIKILEFLSFLYADKIPWYFIHSLFSHVEETGFLQSLKLLKKYSLIKIQDRDSSLSIHRQLQFAVLQSLSRQPGNKILSVSTSLIEKCRFALQNVKLAESSDTFLNIYQIVNNPLNLIPMTEDFVDFMSEFAYVLSDSSRCRESLDLYQKVEKKYFEMLGEEDPKTLKSQYFVARQMMELAKYDESLALFKETLRKQQVAPDLGMEHPDTISTSYGIAFVLKMQKKYTESLALFEQVLEQRNKVLGENDSATLNVHNMIALLHLALGDLRKALPLFEELEKKQIEILGVDNKTVLNTKSNKASVLFDLGRFQEASTIFHEVYEKSKELLGKNHVKTTVSLEWTGNTLYAEGKWAEALAVQKRVYEIRRSTLGEDHPYTIHTKTNISRVSHNIKAKNEPCVIS